MNLIDPILNSKNIRDIDINTLKILVNLVLKNEIETKIYIEKINEVKVHEDLYNNLNNLLAKSLHNIKDALKILFNEVKKRGGTVDYYVCNEDIDEIAHNATLTFKKDLDLIKTLEELDDINLNEFVQILKIHEYTDKVNKTCSKITKE